MRHTLLEKYSLILVGFFIMVWGVTSAFSDLARRQGSQPNPLDNPDAAGSEVTIPSQTLIYPTAGSGHPTSTPDDSSAFSIPIQSTPSAQAGTPSAIPLEGLVPERIVIPAIHLDAPIKPVPYKLVKVNGQVFQQWSVPDEFAVGWQDNSAMIGVPGNTVLNGHHNVWGEVFGRLIDLNPGDMIEIESGATVIQYQISNKMILPERDQPLSVRFENARWMLPTQDERITLVTCWPHTSNTHRLILVAIPVGRYERHLSRIPHTHQ
ncbi:MAG: sortase [Anaerolineaceae bacterium]|nr:sortase [Anaerolineaceae bacterium]